MDPLVVLTGAGAGIGRAAALALAASGWRCLLVDRDAEALERLLPELAGGGHRGLAVDLTEAAAFPRIAKAVEGQVSALISNAGMSDSSGLPLAEQAPAQIARLMALNLEAPARLFTALREKLAPGARIVNVASGAGLRAIPLRGAYSPSKAGVIAMGAALAKAEPGFCVTTLCPGFVRTELVEGLIAAGRLDPAQAVGKVPLGRMGEPSEMAEALAFLASEAAGPLSGSTVSLCGGSSIFGGSSRFAPNTRALLPLGAANGFEIRGDAGLAAVLAGQGPYPARIERLGGTGLLGQLHLAASRFAAEIEGPASLTLLLPPRPESDWQGAADHAAARMAIATLACEWGASSRRINGLEAGADTGPHTGPEALAGILAWMAGARAQFLTGQVIVAGGRK